MVMDMQRYVSERVQPDRHRAALSVTAMERFLVLWVCEAALTLQTATGNSVASAFAGHTDNVALPFPHGNQTEKSDIQATHTAAVPAYNISSCFVESHMKTISIISTNGHVYFKATKLWKGLRECIVSLQVPKDKFIKLQITKCNAIFYFRAILCDKVRDPFGESIGLYCRDKPAQIDPIYSAINRLTVHLQHTLPNELETGQVSFSFSFSAVSKSEKPGLEVVFLSSSEGYVQTTGWNGRSTFPPWAWGCVTLTPPPTSIIFVSVFNVNVGGRDFNAFSGQCRSLCCEPTPRNLDERTVFLFPDGADAERQDQDYLLSFDLPKASYHSQHSGFRVRFSFHSNKLKPRQVPGSGSKWNCSSSVWPTLVSHFPCDLIPQCSESEDEALCPYTTDKCGLHKQEAGGRCYVFGGLESYSFWKQAAMACRRRGSLLVSLETYQEWVVVNDLLQHAVSGAFSRDLAVDISIGLTATRTATATASLNSMYTNTCYWDSESVAYYWPPGDDIPQEPVDICGSVSTARGLFKLHFEECSKQSRSLSFFLCEIFSKTVWHITLPVSNMTTLSPVSIVTCPLQHVIHTMLACDTQSVCRRLDMTGEWYSVKCDMPGEVAQPYFSCAVTGEFVPYSLLCDFREDCPGGRDEDFCEHPVCQENEMNCGQQQCVDFHHLCNGYEDCKTGRDETECVWHGMRATLTTSKPPVLVNLDRPGAFTTIPLPGNVTHCPETHFQCHGGDYCLPVYVRCNDVNDCPNHEDEEMCSSYMCPGFYRCRGSGRTTCVHMHHLCDSLPQCPQHDDELMCDMTCPESCTCYGLTFICRHTFHTSSFPLLRHLDAKESGLQQADVTDHVMLVHLGAGGCRWSNVSAFELPNLHSLDLSGNLIIHVSFRFFMRTPHLRRLNLAGNPISRSMFDLRRRHQLHSLRVFNFSRVRLHSLRLDDLSVVLPNLEALDLSQNEIRSLRGKHSFPNLRVLDMQGCPVLDFTPDFMKDMKSLTHVFADNTKLCCSAVLPDTFTGECSSPSDELSSCENLLRSNVYRLALGASAVLAVCGNLCSLMYRLCFLSEGFKVGFAVFILHLCISDFLMGVYLSCIGVADQVFSGVYIWRETEWKQSEVCSVVGFSAFLSSEVSALLICLITLDRFLVIRLPFSQVRFGATSAHIACIITWILGLVLATVPLLPATSHWEFYHQKGICIPLPITRAEFAGHSYSFSIIIICNLVLFLLIAVGQCLIYWSVRANAMSDQGTETRIKSTVSVKSKEVIIARRLLSIAMSDFLCWFPIGVCGVLSVSGVIIPGEVNVAMAIFVLPLNSALNPFLYTLNVIYEKRQKMKELRFQKFLLAYLKNEQLKERPS